VFPVGRVGERLEIHVCRVDQRVKCLERLRAHETVRDQHIEQALVPGALRDVAGVLEIDRGLGVGIGDAAAPGPAGALDNETGRDPHPADDALIARHGRDVGVLAPAAAEIAAGRRDGIRQRAGRDVVQGFLLDRVDVFRQNLLIHQCVQRAAAVFPHVADPAAAVVDQAPVGAEMAFHLVAVAFFIESGFVHGRSFR